LTIERDEQELRSRRMKRWLGAAVVVLVLGAAGWTLADLQRPYRGYAGTVLLEIPPGEQVTAVAGTLVARGVLAHRLPFLMCYGLGRLRHRLKAGEYFFDRPLRPVDVYRKLVYGDVYLHTVVVPEGSDRFDIARILHERLGLDPREVLHVTEQGAGVGDLDPQAPSLEGYLYPDTYRFARGVSPAAVAAAMLARFHHVLETKFREELPPGSARLHEVITLASLVEKETPDPAERPVIAGVFQRRLAKGMALQCDPTVIYAARLDGRPPGPLAESDLDFDSPYNTYRRTALPPGPIANPGEVSIRAALNPAGGDALYFVSNNHSGHVFARTLAEHQRNVARYRREVAALSVNRRIPEKAKGTSRSVPRSGSSAAAQTRKSAKHIEQEANHP
jgi:UPF0755 protein